MDTAMYLSRLGLPPSLLGSAPSLDLLCQLQQAHLATIPFENLSVHIPVNSDSPDDRIPLRKGPLPVLSLDSLFQKLILSKRGGFCFELNTLFHALLEAFGFTATLSPAFGSTDTGFKSFIGHVVILVLLPQDKSWWMVDVGWGGGGSTCPLKQEEGLEGRGLGGEKFRIQSIEDDLNCLQGNWVVERFEDDEWEQMCRFGNHCTASDLEETCYLASTSPVRGQPRGIGMYLSDGVGGRITFYASGKDPVDGVFLENETVPVGVFSRWRLDSATDQFNCVKVERIEVSTLSSSKTVWLTEFGIEI
ncbi:hypothetical protein BDR26DRAFT_853377 [Obelidium mucronatum]|nr:hypothetical protein BDR26DRAFT_853377 [Obelidium mucronatum]